MKVEWQFDHIDVERLQTLVKSSEIDPPTILSQPVTKKYFWHSLVVSLLSPRQSRLEKSILTRLINTSPFPLRLEACLPEINAVSKFVGKQLYEVGWYFRTDIIGKQISANLAYLESGGWRTTLATLERVRELQTPEAEQDAVVFISDNFKGCGPSISRVLLQELGLARYETPISNRLIKWLNQNGFPIVVSHNLSHFLEDPTNYDFISTCIRKLCEQAGVLPCVLKTAVDRRVKDETNA
ncbi:MAG TPA: hypothetical protein VMJ32_12270 [Pirellulales bacterium]|nr:hypothetical protein [Pirellulales bacterium]